MPPDAGTATARTGPAQGGGTAPGDASLFAPGYRGGPPAAREAALPGTGWRGAPGGAAGKGPVRGFPPAPGQPPPLYPPGQFAAWNRVPAGRGNGDGPADTAGGWQPGYPGGAGAAGAGYADAGYADAGYADAGHADAGYADAGHADTGYADAGYAGAGYRDPGHPDEGYAGPGHPGQGNGLPGYAAAAPAEAGYSALAVSDPAADVTSTQSWEIIDDPAAGPRDTTGPQGAATGPFDLATPAPFSRPAPAPPDASAAGQGQRPATVPGRRAGHATGPRPVQPPGRGQGTRGRGSRGRKRARGTRRRARAAAICVLALVVVAGAAYFWLTSGRKPQAPAADARRAGQPANSARSSPKAPSPSPTPSSQWGHIESRALDPVPLSLAELFPASFSDGTASYVKTVQKQKTHCAAALVGSQLVAAVGRAHCTQAMRASYLSSSHKLMGTIGVLNLATATAAKQAGKAAGPSEYIAQLPAARGPTRNLAKGTGFEAAEVKGHYLVLVWAEFANLRAPGSAAQRTELEAFISLLMQKTANVSLATRQVTGSPPP